LLTVVLKGGAGVISKEIDSKPFFDSLTRIMTEAYRFAKEGGNASGNKTISGVEYESTRRILNGENVSGKLIFSTAHCTS
jgi:hypothetical protein